MTMKVIARTRGTERATDDACAPPERQEAHDEHDRERLEEGALELEDGVVHDRGLVATCSISIPRGTVSMNPLVARATSSPKVRMFAPFAITTPIPRAGLPRCRTR
jgi:hypothetical protein